MQDTASVDKCKKMAHQTADVVCGLEWTSLINGEMGLKSGLENEKNA